MNIMDCEQAKSCDCCYCQNMEYYKVQQKLEKLKNLLVKIRLDCYITDFDYQRLMKIIEGEKC